MIKHCRVCGKEYDSCYSCEKVNSWRALTDTEEHYYMLCVLMEYQSGHDAKKAVRALRKRNVNLQDSEQYLPTVRDLLVDMGAIAREEIRAEETPVVYELAEEVHVEFADSEGDNFDVTEE